MARMAFCMSGWRRVLRRSVVRALGLGMEVPRREKAAFSRGTRRVATMPLGPARARGPANQASSRRWLPTFSMVPRVQARPVGLRAL
eukprot:scaffold16943_cov58-Phaeocystis_antarctica.AAC.1